MPNFLMIMMKFESIFDNFLIWQVPMAPKRSQTSSSYDADRFVSTAASKCYEQSLLKKVLIGEMGFSIQEETSSLSIG